MNKHSENETPLVSIVTVVYNGEKHISSAVESVLNQTYNNIEYIVIDGGSKDATLEILDKYKSRIDVLISEPDEGISDAFNKGVRKATGAIIGIINSDDWYEPDAVESVVDQLQESDAFVYGGMRVYLDDDSYVYQDPEDDYSLSIRYKMPTFNFPTVFFKASMYEKAGLFDKRLSYAMDYDLLLRLFKMGFYGKPINKHIANMRTGGVSVRDYPLVRREVKMISVRHGSNKSIAELYYFYYMLRYFVRCFIKKVL
ncbi:MAG: glycosyltransferase family 2 protein [Motiliproteus sp.]